MIVFFAPVLRRKTNAKLSHREKIQTFPNSEPARLRNCRNIYFNLFHFQYIYTGHLGTLGKAWNTEPRSVYNSVLYVILLVLNAMLRLIIL